MMHGMYQFLLLINTIQSNFMRNLFPFFIIFFFAWILAGCTRVKDDLNTISQASISSEVHYEKEITSDSKAEFAKNRRKQIQLIRKGDFFMAKNNPEEALVSYLEALEKLPDDLVIEKKIAEAYYASKDWSNAYLYFTRVPIKELKEDEKNKMFHALFFDSSRIERASELQKFSLGTGETEYYKILDICSVGIEPCIESLTSYSWSYEKLTGLSGIIKNASKISPDSAYRNFSLATEFYVIGEYRVSYELAQNILRERSDYFDVKKLAWFSLFALGRYTEARQMLRSYIENYPKDAETIVRLGEIAGILKEYTEANLYLNNAIIAGYPGKSDIERALAYNYSQLWDTSAMIKVLSYLLSEKDVLEDDYAVAISLAFARGENARAYVWSIEWLKRFPDSAIIAPMYMMSLRIMWREPEVLKYVATLTGEILTSPLIMLELGINAFDTWDYEKAKEYFDSVYKIDSGADFGIEAENYLTQIQAKEDALSAQEEKVEPVVSEEKNWWWF
jgi:tetratricopeptide (TPR) repeat protein